MKRIVVIQRFAIGLVFTVAALSLTTSGMAQSDYGYNRMPSRPLYRPVHSYPAGWGLGYYHSSTAAEGFLRGRAAVIDALGNYQVNEGQAEILREQARAWTAKTTSSKPRLCRRR